MDTLPPEIVWRILERADVLTLIVCGCANTDWRHTVLKVSEARRRQKPASRGCRIRNEDGSFSQCLTPRRCAILFSNRALAQRRWNLFECIVERTLPIEGSNTIDVQACTVAAEDGDINRLSVFIKERGYRAHPRDVSKAAGRYGRLAVIEWLERNRRPWHVQSALCGAIKGAHNHVIEWLIKHQGWKRLPTAAAKYGRKDLIERMVASEGKDALGDSMWATDAAKGGHVGILAWLVKNGCCWNQKGCCRAGAARGHIAVVHWMIANAHCSSVRACEALIEASRRGHLNVIQSLWTDEHKYNNGYTCMRMAADGGHVHVLEWLKGQGCLGSDQMCTFAAESGKIGALEWCLAQGFKWDLAYSIDLTVFFEHTDVLVWEEARRRETMPRERWLGNDLAEVGAIKKRIREFTLKIVAHMGNLGILQWLHRHGILDVDMYGSTMCTHAVKGGHVGTVAWLRSLGCEWKPGKCASIAAKDGNIDLLAWLARDGYAFDATVVAKAIAKGHHGTAEWLRAHGAP